MPQAPPRDAKPRPPVRTATVAGRVVDAVTGSAIVGARVHLSRIEPPEISVGVESGGGGRFEARGLPEGGYRIFVSPPFLQATHVSMIVNNDRAAAVAGDVTPSVVLKPGEIRDDLVIRLDRAIAVDGRVVDEAGMPMANLRIEAERPGGGPSLRPGREIRSDDRGMFRVFGLPPGPYQICAVPPLRPPLGDPPTGELPRKRYTKTCSDTAGASVVIQMQRSGTYTISGHVSSESGSTDMTVSISTRESGSVNDFAPRVIVSGGQFLTPALPPGEYNVSVFARFERTGANESASTEAGGTVVRLVDSDLTGIDLLATRGATVRGRVVSETPLPRGVALEIAALDPIESSNLRSIALPRPTPVQADRTFEVTGLRDPVLWDVRGLPEGWAVAAVRYRGADVTDAATRLSATTDPALFEILVAPNAARLFIRPTGGVPAVPLRAFVFSAAGNRQIGPPLIQKTEVDGTLVMPAVRPGEYLVAVVRAQDLRALARTPGQVTALKRAAQRVVLAAGEKRTIEVRVTPLTELR